MRQTLEYHIDEKDAGERLDHFLASRLDWLSRMRINSLIAEGACAVNREVGQPGYHLTSDDMVEVTLDEEMPSAMTPAPAPLDIIYEDAHLMVVNKMAGMLVHPTRGEKSGTLANALAYHLNFSQMEESDAVEVAAKVDAAKRSASNRTPLVRPGLVHRLDRATSGLMVIAKHQRALTILSRHFHRRLVEKRYLALVHGLIMEDELVIAAPVGRDAAAHPKWRVSAGGKHAETRLRVVERRGGLTFVELEPVTGRTNQLRIHCAHVGHAIVGDDWYGSDSSGRLCLHAARLAFHHPANGDWMEFASSLPEEIKMIWNALA